MPAPWPRTKEFRHAHPDHPSHPARLRRHRRRDGAAGRTGRRAPPGASTASALVAPIAEVLDGGEQVTSLAISSPALHRAERASLTPSTFAVHVTATNPLTGEVAYQQDRVVTAARWTRRVEIVLELEHGWGVEGGGTLQYLGAYGRNVRPGPRLRGHAGRAAAGHGSGSGAVVLDSFRQGRLSDPRGRRVHYHATASGLNYRLFSPRAAWAVRRCGARRLVARRRRGRPADRRVRLLRQRGAASGQPGSARVRHAGGAGPLGGAYVLAPQSPRRGCSTVTASRRSSWRRSRRSPPLTGSTRAGSTSSAAPTAATCR